eukprot:GHUV01016679.1.p1 GENE.GHUV01016679.1~~GHUV01016679.1.p1  ORF type:complete len:620 (+),score=228.40 GHUV01016679.1:769-2628(+)
MTLPVEPWLQPTGDCNTGTAGLGPAVDVASPLGYRVLLAFQPEHFVAGDDSGAVAAGFQVAANITLAVLQDTACVSLHVRNLSFTSIQVRLVTDGKDDRHHHEQEAVCLCGTEAGCSVSDCGKLFRKHPAADVDSWVMSLGDLTAPAGSSLLIETQHTAYFGDKQGVWRSAPFTKSVPGAAAGTHVDRQQQVLVNTQFEPTGARMVFPCMDEPKHKAPVVVMIRAPAHLTSISNMPEVQHSTSAGSSSDMVTVEFLPSPPMSTYLVAIAVGDLDSVTAHITGGKQVSVWFPRGQSWITPAATAVPLQLAVAALEHYTRYTGVMQPLRKFDLVAVPGKPGAMENWGLLLFDTERLLYTHSGAWALLRCATVICHEVGHQWFGNLVTAASWSDLLVNEGLASLAEYGCLAEVLGQQLGTEGAAAVMRHVAGPHGRKPGVHEGPFNKALTYDASPSAAPLLGWGAAGSGDVDFGVLVYSKAASVLAMLVEYGATGSTDLDSYDDAMREGPVTQLVGSKPTGATQVALQQYLHQHIYGPATAQQVFELFLNETPQAMASNVMSVISGWRAPGSPLLTVQGTHHNQVSSANRGSAWAWPVCWRELSMSLVMSTKTALLEVSIPW